MFQNLLLAVDVNAPDSASRSAQAAISFARNEAATLHLLNVVPDSGMAIVGASLGAARMSKVMTDAQSELEVWRKANIPDDINCKPHVTEGTIYDQIIRVAQKLDVDAIIVGSHRPELKDYLIGPNAARVARHATQSVFVVR